MIQLKGITGSACDTVKADVASYILKNVKPDSQSFSSSIGDNKTVTLDFSTQIGGPRDTNAGVFFAGVTNSQSTQESIQSFAD